MHSKKASRSVNKIGVPIVDIFEYLIFQPCFNRAESKIILLGGKAQYTVSTTRTGLLHSPFEQKPFWNEASNHLLALKTCGAFLSDGLVRIDLFC
jgi:hypothetical protein